MEKNEINEEKKKARIRKIILIILFLPIFAVWYIWKKTNWSNNKKLLATAGIIVLILVAGVSSSSEEKQKVVEKTPVQKNAVQEQVPKTKKLKKKEVTQKGDKKSSPSIMDKLWLALDASMGTRKGYSIEYNKVFDDKTGNGARTVTITKAAETYWDGNDAVRNAYAILVKYGKRVFPMDEVFVVKVKLKGNFIDAYGKKSTDDAVVISMTKFNFNKFDWDNLNYSPISEQMEKAASEYYINPAIKKNLKEDKLYLAI